MSFSLDSGAQLPPATQPLKREPSVNKPAHHHGKSDKHVGHVHSVNYLDPNWIAPLSDAPLSFGYGELLKDGAGEGDADDTAALDAIEQEVHSGKTLKGRYIVRVGWDDVRGWMADGGTLIGSSRCPSCESGRTHMSVRSGL